MATQRQIDTILDRTGLVKDVHAIRKNQATDLCHQLSAIVVERAHLAPRLHDLHLTQTQTRRAKLIDLDNLRRHDKQH